MGTQQNAPERMKIIVGADFSEMSDRALGVALNLARSAGAAEIHLIHVLAPPVGGTEFAPPMDVAENTKLVRKQLDDATKRLAGIPEVVAFSHVVVGSAAKEIAHIADELEADLIVIGTHGRGRLDRALFGSVAEAVVRTAPCSVLTVRPKAKSAASTIEPACQECLAVAARTAGKEGRCAQHVRHRPGAHTYSEMPDGYGLGSMTFRF